MSNLRQNGLESLPSKYSILSRMPLKREHVTYASCIRSMAARLVVWYPYKAFAYLWLWAHCGQVLKLPPLLNVAHEITEGIPRYVRVETSAFSHRIE